MRVLVVGAGAVGQVFGWHLSRGGADVGFLVKARHEPELRKGLRLRWLNASEGWTTWRDHEVITEPGPGWDAIVLAVASDALSPSWLEPLARATGDATVAVMQPGLEDRARVSAAFGEARVVRGLVGLIAFQCPLAGDPRFQEEGVAWWFGPFVKTLLEGERARPLVDTFRRGGLPVALATDVGAKTGFGAAVLNPIVAALEIEGWSLAALRKGRWLGVATSAAQQIAGLVALDTGKTVPLALSLLSPGTAGVGLALAPSVVPFDLEAYLRAHFTKVGSQTRVVLANYLTAAKGRGLPCDALEALRAALP